MQFNDQRQAATTIQPQKKTLDGKAIPIPNGITQADVDNPENMSLLYSIEYCESRAKQCMDQLMKMTEKGIRADPHLKATMKECQKVKRMLEAGANSE